jgi:hypothetical protein
MEEEEEARAESFVSLYCCLVDSDSMELKTEPVDFTTSLNIPETETMEAF